MTSQLDTPRLTLRQFQESDLDAYASMCANPEVMRFIGAGEPLSRKEAWRELAFFLGHWRLRGYGMWALEHSTSGQLIGRAGFINPEGWPGFELGWLLDRDYWGEGYATEAARAALQHAFDDLEREHVISLIYPENSRSIRVAERLGQTLERETELYGNRVDIYAINRP